MNDVSKRFLELLEILISHKKVANGKEFAESIGVSISMITEIIKGRSNVGITAIQNTVRIYNVDSNWILTGLPNGYLNGYLDGYLNGNISNKTSYKTIKKDLNESASTNKNGGCSECESKERLIVKMEETIKALQMANKAQEMALSGLHDALGRVSSNDNQKRRAG